MIPKLLVWERSIFSKRGTLLSSWGEFWLCNSELRRFIWLDSFVELWFNFCNFEWSFFLWKFFDKYPSLLCWYGWDWTLSMVSNRTLLPLELLIYLSLGFSLFIPINSIELERSFRFLPSFLTSVRINYSIELFSILCFSFNLCFESKEGAKLLFPISISLIMRSLPKFILPFFSLLKFWTFSIFLLNKLLFSPIFR